jgi:membrane-bound serine protease (ClpP class)
MGAVELVIWANVLYTCLVAGIWLAALGLVSPGSGVIEILALLSLSAVGVGALFLPVNLWALAGLGLGALFFAIALLRRRQAVWLAASAVIISLSSAFLFGTAQGQPAVHPALAIMLSALTLAFFWFSVRQTLAAHAAPLWVGGEALIGEIGEARTLIDHQGSVQMRGELWSASSTEVIPAGSRVRVVSRSGLMLIVEAADSLDTKGKE